jgi:RNA polymerase-binding transcription factor DksA
VSKNENEKTKATPLAAKPSEQKEDTSKNNTPQNRPSVGRPMPVNRRPEPARAIISNKPKEAESSKTRYSDAELDEFRQIINVKLENARKELALLQQQMTAANEHGTDDTASTFKILEDGSDSLAKEEAGQLASRQKKFIEQLENALVRIENKTYGICRVTGKLIPKERLRAVPHTTQSIEAKLNQYRD